MTMAGLLSTVRPTSDSEDERVDDESRLSFTCSAERPVRGVRVEVGRGEVDEVAAQPRRTEWSPVLV